MWLPTSRKNGEKRGTPIFGKKPAGEGEECGVDGFPLLAKTPRNGAPRFLRQKRPQARARNVGGLVPTSRKNGEKWGTPIFSAKARRRGRGIRMPMASGFSNSGSPHLAS